MCECVCGCECVCVSVCVCVGVSVCVYVGVGRSMRVPSSLANFLLNHSLQGFHQSIPLAPKTRVHSLG